MTGITNLIQFCTFLSLAVFWIWGWYCLFDSNYLFGWLHARIENAIGYKICKPLFSCPPCMASVHGTALYLILFSDKPFLDWFLKFDWVLGLVLFVVMLVGINYLIIQVFFSDDEDEDNDNGHLIITP